MRGRETLSALIEGRLSSPDGRSELVKLATRLILEEALEAETQDALGRDYYERAAERWRAIRFTEFERRQIAAVRQELDEQYETDNDTRSASQKPRPTAGISSSSRT